jgi:hypothetical protein
MKIPAFFLFLIVFFSCSSNKTENKGSLKKLSSVSFVMDKTTIKESNTFQYFKSGEKEYVALFNQPKEEIVIYDYSSTLLSKKIKLEEEGPNGVGLPFSFYVKSMDSIFVISSALYSLSLIDSSGTVINQFKLIPGGLSDFGTPLSESYTSKPLMQSTNPFLFFSDTLVAVTGIPNKNPTQLDYYKDSPLYILLNLKNGSFRYSFSYPQSYQGNLWGMYHNFPFHTYNTKEKKAVISFPISDKLFLTDFTNSQEFSCPCQNLGAPKIWSNPDLSDPVSSIKHFMESPSYYRIVYDPYRDLYYRFCQFSTEVDLKSIRLETFSVFKEKKTMVAVYDSKFTFKNQIDLPKDTDPRFLFINEKGLHIYKENQNEDILLFDIYRFEL